MVPMIGCASHRCNLAVKEYLISNNYENVIEKVNDLMKKCRTMKAAATIRKNRH